MYYQGPPRELCRRTHERTVGGRPTNYLILPNKYIESLSLSKYSLDSETEPNYLKVISQYIVVLISIIIL